MDIQLLLKRIKQGDRAAYSSVVQHFQRPLFGYLGRMGLAQSVVEELAQETFIRVWKHLNDFNPTRAQFSTWLFTIARNLALHEFERAAGKREVYDDAALQDAISELPQAEALISQKQLHHQLRAALNALPLPDRSVLALAYFQELDLKAIANIEGCSVSAVKVRLHRAKQRLRQLMEENDA